MVAAPSFHVVSGSVVKDTIDGNMAEVFYAVESAYRMHAAGDSVNPDSYFLRFPDKPSSRIIALPAHLGGAVQKSGIKWISSFPENTASNLARASAVLILNDAETGYPLACLEASLISSTRTAASAALAAEHITPDPFKGNLGIVGTGIIARTTVEWLIFRNWNFGTINLFDADPKSAEHFAKWLRDTYGLRADIKDDFEDALCQSSMIVFTTTTLAPYLDEPNLLKHAPSVLHLSLRDICPNVILASQNFADDIEHSMKANTSLHLTETQEGNRDFVSGTLVDVLDNKVKLDHNRPRIFSPFGLGVLDIAVGNIVLEKAIAAGQAVEMPDFFSNSTRW